MPRSDERVVSYDPPEARPERAREALGDARYAPTPVDLDDPRVAAEFDSLNLLGRLESLPALPVPRLGPFSGPFGVVGFGEGAWPAEVALSMLDGAITAAGTQFILNGGFSFGDAAAAELIAGSSGARVVVIGQGGSGAALTIEPSPLSAFEYLAAIAGATGHDSDLDEARRVMTELAAGSAPQVPTAENPAKALAWELLARTPLLIAPREYRVLPWAYQLTFSRVAKTLAITLPENYLEVLSGGFEARHETADSLAGLVLGGEDPAVELARELLADRAPAVRTIPAPQSASRLARVLGLWYLGQWIAFYLAALYRADPGASLVLDKVREAAEEE
jgi:hypothetical protein